MALGPLALTVGTLAVAATAVVGSPSTSAGTVSAPASASSRDVAFVPRARAAPPLPVAPGPASPRGRRFRWPLAPAPTVLRRFAVGPHPWSPGHRGVDLAAEAGQAVLAAGPGVVTFAGRVAGVGVVVVDHGDGLRTTYQPVDAPLRVGAPTVAGTTIGRLGDWPGHCTASCLHWGAIRGGAYVDPLALLGLVPPVLLPLTGTTWP